MFLKNVNNSAKTSHRTEEIHLLFTVHPSEMFSEEERLSGSHS